MTSLDMLQQKLKESGFSLTAPRRQVFRTIEAEGPCTISEIQEKVSPHVHRASTYRVVQLFERLGIVQRIPMGWKYKLELSDMFTDHHHHAHCTSCDKIVKLEQQSDIEMAIESLARRNHFKLESHSLEMSGICYECSLKKS
jgi:Fur family transcriptional regulator, ferric uptake regulator